MRKITVFTPTFNRGYIIKRLYDSLVSQSFKDFEWVVVDDGSTDSTSEIVKSFIDEDILDIKFLRVSNGGKHRAVNRGLDISDGELFFIVDSDDYILPDALEKIVKFESSISGNNSFAGIALSKGYSSSKLVGSTFANDDFVDLLNYERDKFNISGDKAEVYYTDILRKYKFPEFDGENFLTEAVLWNKIALDGYLLRYFKDIVYICDYLDDGLTKAGEKKYRDNPIGFTEYIKQWLFIYRHNFCERVRYISYYKAICTDVFDNKTICKNLNVSMVMLLFSDFVRKTFKR